MSPSTALSADHLAPASAAPVVSALPPALSTTAAGVTPATASAVKTKAPPTGTTQKHAGKKTDLDLDREFP
jgi:hypothetical protein